MPFAWWFELCYTFNAMFLLCLVMPLIGRCMELLHYINFVRYIGTIEPPPQNWSTSGRILISIPVSVGPLDSGANFQYMLVTSPASPPYTPLTFAPSGLVSPMVYHQAPGKVTPIRSPVTKTMPSLSTSWMTSSAVDRHVVKRSVWHDYRI